MEVAVDVTVPIRLAFFAVSMATYTFWFTVFTVAELAGARTSYTIEAVKAVFSVVPLAEINVMVIVLDDVITTLEYLLGKLIGIPAGYVLLWVLATNVYGTVWAATAKVSLAIEITLFTVFPMYI